MTTYVMRGGQLVDKRRAGPRHETRQATNVISDTIDPIKHMGTGELIDSKSKYRQATRAAGLTEVGTDPAIRRAMPTPEPSKLMLDIVTDVQRSLAELRR